MNHLDGWDWFFLSFAGFCVAGFIKQAIIDIIEAHGRARPRCRCACHNCCSPSSANSA